MLSSIPTNPFTSDYLWNNYPHTPLSPLLKFYYLAQLGFWIHQLVIFNLEARRKDYYQMLAHHVVTIVLVAGSYWGNFTRVGLVILVLMDFCDIWLPVSRGVFENIHTAMTDETNFLQLAKLFRYLRRPVLTDATFVVFLVSWLITRQLGFFLVTLSAWFKTSTHIAGRWDPSRGVYGATPLVWGFRTLLVVLLVMNCIWFGMACGVAWRVVRGLGAEDSRSDDEDVSEHETGSTSTRRRSLSRSKQEQATSLDEKTAVSLDDEPTTQKANEPIHDTTIQTNGNGHAKERGENGHGEHKDGQDDSDEPKSLDETSESVKE